MVNISQEEIINHLRCDVNVISTKTNLEFQGVFTNFSSIIRANIYTLSKKGKLRLLESVLYDIQKLDNKNHHSLIDPNSYSYCALYDQEVSSFHSKNISYLSALLDVSKSSDIEDPIKAYFDFECFVTSKHFLKSGLNHENSLFIKKLLKKLYFLLSETIKLIQTSRFKLNYQNLGNLEKFSKHHPKEFKNFIQNLSTTAVYINNVCSKI